MPDTEMNTPPDPPPPGRRSAFEWSLAALRPADADVARPSFMFKAGQESRNKVVRFWRCVAGGLAVVMATGGVAAFGVIQSGEQRELAVRAELQAKPMAVLAPVVPPPAVEPTPDTTAATSVSVQIVTRPTPPADDTPAGEVAAALERRRNILIGGLGLIPDAPPELPKAAPTSPGVFAAPRVDKKPTPPADPETEDRPPNSVWGPHPAQLPHDTLLPPPPGRPAVRGGRRRPTAARFHFN